MSIPDVIGQLFLGWLAYFIAVASPGPAILAITGTAMHTGRKAGLVFAMGVLTGSLFWGVLAALGMSALMATYGNLIFALKISGGVYLLYLSAKAFRSALSQRPNSNRQHIKQPLPWRSLYLRGLGLHLTNPKPIFAWLALVSLGLPKDAPGYDVPMFIGGCMVIGFFTFCGFALIFSIPCVLAGYQKARRGIEISMGIFFAYAGFRMLTVKF